MPELISEIAEADASGETARIYGEIRRLWGVPNVTTVVRHVATFPGCLEWLWATIGPTNDCGDFQATANALSKTLDATPLPALPELALRAMGVDERATQQIRDVYDAYNRNNRPNILFVCTLSRLLREGPGGKAPYAPGQSGWRPPAQLPPLVPMVQASNMPPATLALAQAIGSWGFPPDTGFLPGVYRHLANWPAYMAYAGAMLWPRLEAGETARAGAAMLAAAETASARLVGMLPPPEGAFSPPSPDEAQALLRFLDGLKPKIPEMIIVCKLLGDALPDNEKE